jgi:hypothetical protein
MIDRKPSEKARAHAEYAEMMTYVGSAECRAVHIGNNFGFPNAAKCGHCDNCISKKAKSISTLDVSAQALLILDTLKETGDISEGRLCRLLIGAVKPNDTKEAVDTLNVNYGAGKRWSQEQWRHILRELYFQPGRQIFTCEYKPMRVYGYVNLRASADGDLQKSLADGTANVTLRFPPTLATTFGNLNVVHTKKLEKSKGKPPKARKAPQDPANTTPRYVTKLKGKDGSILYRADFKATCKAHGFLAKNGARVAPKLSAGQFETIEDAVRGQKAYGDAWIMKNLTLFDLNHAYVRVLRDTWGRGLLEAPQDGADVLTEHVTAAGTRGDSMLALTLLECDSKPYVEHDPIAAFSLSEQGKHFSYHPSACVCRRLY